MRHTTLASATLAALLVTGGAMAQSHTDPAHSAPTSAAPLGAQQQMSHQADAMHGPRATGGFLRQADAAVAKKDWAGANEYVERAKTAWLNRESLAGSAAQTTDTAFGPAQTAIRARDAAAAHRGIQTAMTAIGQDEGSSRAGAGTGAMPVQGGVGVGAPAQGGAMPPTGHR